MIIDFHTHIISPRIRERRQVYATRDRCFSLLYSDPKAKLATAEELIAAMDRDGVDLSVALNIGWCSHELCVETNDYILESVARYPDRLVGFCAVQPAAGDRALRELERCAQAGARGLGEMRQDVQGFDPADKALMQPLAEIVAKYHLIYLTHSSEPVGHQYPGKGNITPDLLYALVTRFKDLKVVCAHWGGGLPFYALMPEVSEALANVYFDTAATPFLYHREIFVHAMHLVGIDKVLFGSDFPLLSQNRVADHIRKLDLPDMAKDMILGSSAARLLHENSVVAANS